jgi:uncharacterized protein
MAEAAQPVDPKLLETLICPLSKMRLTYDADRQELVCKANGLAYPIRDGVPVLLPDEARETGAAA